RCGTQLWIASRPLSPDAGNSGRRQSSADRSRSLEGGGSGAAPDRGALYAPTNDSGAWALVAVEDAGVGIGTIDPAHLFDAFYTTKPGGSEWGCRSAGR